MDKERYEKYALGERIRKARELNKLTQEKLSELAGCHVNNVGRTERGENDPSYLLLLRFARALKISPRDFMPEK